MILNLKKYTMKMTLVSVFMLVMVGLLFFTRSSGLSYENLTGGMEITDNTNPDLRHYKSDEWNFALDIPGDWKTMPPVASNSPAEVVRFGGTHSLLIVYRSPYDPSKSPDEIRDYLQKTLANRGFGNFIRNETNIGSKTALTLDFDKLTDDSNLWSCRDYFIVDGTLGYVLGFGTGNKAGMFELFDRIAKTFETYDNPATAEFKHYKSDDYHFELDIPSRWNSMPLDPNNNPFMTIRFASQEDGYHDLAIFRNSRDPAQTPEEIRDQRQLFLFLNKPSLPSEHKHQHTPLLQDKSL